MKSFLKLTADLSEALSTLKGINYIDSIKGKEIYLKKVQKFVNKLDEYKILLQEDIDSENELINNLKNSK